LIGAPGSAAELAALYSAIQDIEARSVATTKSIIAAVDQGDTAAANNMMWSQAKPQYVQWLAAINKPIDFQEVHIQAQNKLALEQAGGLVTVMLTALSLALLTGAALAWFISRSIRGQLGAEPTALSDTARRVAGGDLSALPGAAEAAHGSVMASLGAMQASLAGLVGQVRQASDSIATGSQEIAAGNQDLIARIESQASNLQQTTAWMSELSRSVQANADSAVQANKMAASASAAAESGGQVVTRVKEIVASSRRIGDIIGVIDIPTRWLGGCHPPATVPAGNAPPDASREMGITVRQATHAIAGTGADPGRVAEHRTSAEQALTLMQGNSPEYLQHFTVHVETFLALER